MGVATNQIVEADVQHPRHQFQKREAGPIAALPQISRDEVDTAGRQPTIGAHVHAQRRGETFPILFSGNERSLRLAFYDQGEHAGLAVQHLEPYDLLFHPDGAGGGWRAHDDQESRLRQCFMDSCAKIRIRRQFRAVTKNRMKPLGHSPAG
jgi:hypothetical protein